MLIHLKTLDRKHVTPSREMTVVLALCTTCGAEVEILEQNFQRSVRQKRDRCSVCRYKDAHRMTASRIWRIWKGMKERVKNKDDKNYGGRGVDMDPRWLDFKVFHQDMSQGYRDDLTIERMDVNKGYWPWNCRWASNMEQQSNKRNNRTLCFRGQEIHLAELCRVTGLSRGILSPRLNAGMSADEAVQASIKSTYKKNRKSRRYTTL